MMSCSGTTERIFETKTHLYDVYVNNQNVMTQSAALKDLLKVSSADREKFDKLNSLRLVFVSSVTAVNVVIFLTRHSQLVSAGLAFHTDVSVTLC